MRPLCAEILTQLALMWLECKMSMTEVCAVKTQQKRALSHLEAGIP